MPKLQLKDSNPAKTVNFQPWASNDTTKPPRNAVNPESTSAIKVNGADVTVAHNKSKGGAAYGYAEIGGIWHWTRDAVENNGEYVDYVAPVKEPKPAKEPKATKEAKSPAEAKTTKEAKPADEGAKAATATATATEDKPLAKSGGKPMFKDDKKSSK